MKRIALSDTGEQKQRQRRRQRQITHILVSVALVSAVALLGLLGAGSVEAQPAEEFNVTFSEEEGSGAEAVVETSSGRFAVAGFSRGVVLSNRDVLFAKTDRDGKKLFRRTFSRAGLSKATSVVETSDAGFAVAGVGNNKAWLIKTDAAVNEEYDLTLSRGRFKHVNSVVETPDGGIALAGRSQLPRGGSSAWLVKTSEDGSVVFGNAFGVDSGNVGFSDLGVWRGGFALAGHKKPSGSASSDAWLVRADRNGNRGMSETFGGPGLDRVESVAATSDRGVVMAGRTESFGTGNSSDAWLIKTDEEGNEEFNTTFGGEGFDRAFSVVETSDGGYAVAGETESFGSGSSDAWLIKTDEEGNEVFSTTFGGADHDTAKSVVQTSDGGFALAGSTESFGSENRDAWLVKVEGSGTEDDGALVGDGGGGSGDGTQTEHGDGEDEDGDDGTEDGGATRGTQNGDGSASEAETEQETESDVEEVSMPGFTAAAAVVALLLVLAARFRRA